MRANIKITSQKTIQHLQESLSGYVESNIYHKNDFFTDRFYRYKQQLDENIATQQTLQILPARLIEVFAVLGFFILIAINKLSAKCPGNRPADHRNFYGCSLQDHPWHYKNTELYRPDKDLSIYTERPLIT